MTITENPPVAVTAGAGSWRLNVLGPVELCYDGVPVEVSGPTRTLLALLARSPGEEIGTTSIAAGLWGSEPPEDFEREVASNVSRLRKALTVVAPNVDPTSVIVTLPTGYILAIQPSNADILAFERLAADGRRAISVGQPDLGLARLDAALALWRGRAYEDFGEHAFARSEATRLEELRLAALESRVDAQLAISAPIAPAHLATELQTLLAEHWHRERLWAQLMTVLFRLGRRADALAAHRRAQELLAENLHVQPGPELRSVERAVLDADPVLLGAPPAPGSIPGALTGTVPACVGRQEEADWLLAALDLAATRRAQARLVVGSSGIGKTRLMAEVAQRAAARGAVVRHWRADAVGLDSLVAPTDRLTLVIVEDLDQASHDDVGAVASFVRTALARPVVTLVTCRDPVRVGDLQSVPKLVLSGLDDAAVAEIVREYAPSVTDATAASAMVNAGGVPARIHRAASEWAFARAGRRIDRAVADAAEPRRALTALRDEVVAGALELSHVRAKARLLRPSSRTVGCPYPGLAGFSTADAEVFHGRERLVAEVLARLAETPLLALVGAAGAGKSSLVRAGILPAVTAGVLPDSGRWRQVLLTPSTVDSLEEALAPNPELPEVLQTEKLEQVEQVDEAPTEVDGEDQATAPEDEPVEPEEPVEPVETVAPVPVEPRESGPERVLLVVDQFEEVFTVLDPAARAEFLDGVVRHAEQSPMSSVVVVLRSEFYPRCGEHPGLSRLVTANTVLMPPMTDEELRRAIERPAATAGLRIESGLVDRLVAEIGDATIRGEADGEVGLAHLGTALRAQWDRRTANELTLAQFQAENPAGLAGSIEAYAESVFAGLPTPTTREAAQQLLLTLSGPGGTRRTVPVADLVAGAGPDGLTALEILAEGGLVALSSDVDTATLVHDLLLTEWSRLRTWRSERAAGDELRRHLVEAAAVWDDRERESGRLYKGARLVTALDWAERHAGELSPVEKEFLAAGNRAVLAAEIRRRRRAVLLWKWLAATVLVAILAVAVAVVSVAMQLRMAGAAQRADAAHLAAVATTEPDTRLALLLAVAASRLDAATADTVATVLGRTPELMATAGTGMTVVALSPDGATLAAGSADGVLLLRPDGLGAVARLEYPGHRPVNGLAFSADGRRLVSWAGGGQSPSDGANVVVWDLATRRPTGSAFGQAWPGAGGGLLADSSTLVLAQRGGDGPAAPVAWNIEARTPSTAYRFPVTAVDALVVSGDGRLVAFGGAGGTVLLNPDTGEVRTLPAVRHPLAISPDRRTLLAANGNDLQAWNLDTLTLGSNALAAGPGSNALAAGPGGQGHHGQVLAVAWAPGGGQLASVAADGSLLLWDPATLRPVRTLAGGHLALRSVQFGSDGATVFATGDDGMILAWDLTGKRGVAARLAAQPETAVALACGLVGRDMSPEEWHRFLPDRSYQPVCAA